MHKTPLRTSKDNHNTMSLVTKINKNLIPNETNTNQLTQLPITPTFFPLQKIILQSFHDMCPSRFITNITEL